MKKIVLFAIMANLLVACNKTSTLQTGPAKPTLYSSQQIDAFIWKQLKAQHKFDWSSASPDMVWSALEQSDHIMSIGYRPLGVENVETNLFKIDINQPEWKKAREHAVELVLKSEQAIDPSVTLEKIMPWEENILPVVDLVVRNPETVKLLLADKYIRYAEPMGYEPKEAVTASKSETGINQAVASSSGCGSNTANTDLIANIDYNNIAPGCKQSWNYSYHRIPQAWTKTTGVGAKVFIIDTGCEFDQENLGSAFNQGYSTGRTVEKIVTLPRSTFLGFPTGPVETPDDGCGHGTCMAGECAAPRAIDGNSCGIAYNCNLVTCRAASDVFLDESREVKGASDAFTNAGNRPDVKVISMSMGKITSSSQLADAINYAYGKGKLIFCAAGTSFSWTSGWFGVIFPAYLSQVNAVTGVRDDNFNTSCTDCHDGSETDFTIVMEKALTKRHPLTLAMTGDLPSTVGGSSVATASAAGIAALVFSRYPFYTRDQVLNLLIKTSANYPNRTAYLGWGNLNADAATN